MVRATVSGEGEARGDDYVMAVEMAMPATESLVPGLDLEAARRR